MVFKKKNLVEDFTIALSKMEAIEFLGVCKVLGIEMVKKDGAPRKFNELLWEVVQKFIALNRKEKKELVKLVRAVNKNRK